MEDGSFFQYPPAYQGSTWRRTILPGALAALESLAASPEVDWTKVEQNVRTWVTHFVDDPVPGTQAGRLLKLVLVARLASANREDTREQIQSDRDPLCWDAYSLFTRRRLESLKPSRHSISVLFEVEGYGVSAKLHAEAVPNGLGSCYCHPCNWWLVPAAGAHGEDDFFSAVQDMWGRVRQSLSGQVDFDVRWWLEFDNRDLEKRVSRYGLTGRSATAAFYVVFHAVALAAHKRETRRQLRSTHESVAVTAEVSADGVTLSPVGSVWEKVRNIWEHVLRIKTVIVAPDDLRAAKASWEEAAGRSPDGAMHACATIDEAITVVDRLSRRARPCYLDGTAHQLTEGFRGRQNELDQILGFCRHGSGRLMIWGKLGYGKSALLARAFMSLCPALDPEGADGAGTVSAVIGHFVRRSMDSGRRDVFLRVLNRELGAVCDRLGIRTEDDANDLLSSLEERVGALDTAETPPRVVLLVDGLDKADPDLLKAIPEAKPWLVVVVSSNPVSCIQNFDADRDRENRDEMQIGPLGAEDVRAMLEGATGAAVPSEYVQAVVERSGGWPLYLSLLCKQIAAQGAGLPGVARMPPVIGDRYIDTLNLLYKDTVNLLTNGGREEDTLSLLNLLAVARAPLADDAVAEFLGTNSTRACTVVDSCRTLLLDSFVDNTICWSLFHDTLREWLLGKHAAERQDASRRLADRCFAWRERKEATAARRYAFAHAAAHLHETNDHDRLSALLRDEEYREAQIAEFGEYGPALDALRHGLELYVERNGVAESDDGQLCWLALRTCELAERAKTEAAGLAYDWARNRDFADPRPMQRALRRIAVLSDEEYSTAALRLLSIEAERQGALTAEHRSSAGVRLIYEAINKRFGGGPTDAYWRRHVSDEFVAALCEFLVEAWPDLPIPQCMRSCFRGGASRESLPELMRVAGSEPAACSRAIEVIGAITSPSERCEAFTSLAQKLDPTDDSTAVCQALGKAIADLGEVEQGHVFHMRRGAILGPGAGRGEDRGSLTVSIAAVLAQTGEIPPKEELVARVLGFTDGLEDEGKRREVLAQLGPAIVQAVTRTGNPALLDQASRTAHAIRRNEDRSLALGELAVQLAQTGRHDKANDAVQSALKAAECITWHEHSGPPRDVLPLLARTLVRGGLFELALDTFETGLRVQEHGEIIKAIIEAAKGTRQTPRGTDLLRRLLGLMDSAAREKRAPSLLTSFALDLGQAGWDEAVPLAFDQALALAESQVCQDVNVRALELAHIAEALLEAGLRPRAAETIRRALGLRRASGAAEDRLISGLTTNAIVRVLVKVGLLDEAFDLISSNWDCPDPLRQEVQIEAALAFAEAKQIDRSTTLLGRLTEATGRAQVQTALVAFFVQHRRMAEAEQMASSIEGAGARSGAMVTVATTLLERGNTEEAAHLFEAAMDGARPDGASDGSHRGLARVAVALVLAGDLPRIAALSERALALVGEITDGLPRDSLVFLVPDTGEEDDGFSEVKWFFGDRRLLKTVASALIQTGHFGRALSLVGRPDAERSKAALFRSLQQAADQIRGMPNEQDLLKHALNVASTCDRQTKMAEAITAFASALARAGEADVATPVFEEALEIALVGGADAGEKGTGLLRSLEQAVEQIRGLPDEQDLLKHALSEVSASDRPVKPTLVRLWDNPAKRAPKVVSTCGHQGRLAKALAFASALARAGKAHVATPVLEEALESARGTKDRSERTYTLLSIAEALVLVGRRDSGHMALQAAREAAEDSWTDLWMVESRFLKAGCFDQAYEMHQTRRTSMRRTGKTSMGSLGSASQRAGALASLAMALAGKGNSSAALKALERALQATTGIESPRRQADMVARIVSVAAGAAGLPTAESLAREAVEATASAYWRSRTWAAIASALIRGEGEDAVRRALEHSITAADQIEDSKEKSDAVRSIAASALAISNPQSREPLLNAAIGLACTVTDESLRNAALRWLSEPLVPRPGLPPSGTVFNDLFDEDAVPSPQGWLSRLESAPEDLAKREWILRRVTDLIGEIPDGRTRAQLLLVVARPLIHDGQLPSLEDLLRMLLEVARQDRHSNQAALEAVAEAVGEVKNPSARRSLLTEALALSEDIESVPARCLTVQRLASASAGSGLLGEAAEAFERAVRLAAGAVARGNPVSLSSLGTALAGQVQLPGRCALLRRALDVVGTIADETSRREEWLAMAVVCARAGFEAEATGAITQVLEEASLIRIDTAGDESRSKAIVSAASAVSEASAPDSARQLLLGRLLPAAEGIKLVVPRSDALRGIVGALFKIGDVASALRTLAGVEPEHVRASLSTPTAVVRALATSRRFEAAFQIASDIQGVEAFGSAMLAVRDALTEPGDFEAALACAAGVQDAEKRVLAAKYITSGLWRLRTEAARPGILGQAFRIVGGTKGDSVRKEAIEWFIRDIVQTEDSSTRQALLDEALAMAGAIQGAQDRGAALATIAEALGEMERPEMATDALDRVMALAKTLQWPDGKRNVLTSTAVALAKRADSQRRIALLDEALTLIAGSPGYQEGAEAMGSVALALAQRGEVNRALRLVQCFQAPLARLEALDGMASALVRSGDLERGLQVAVHIEEPVRKSSVLATIARAMLSQGNVGRAVRVAKDIIDPEKRTAVLLSAADALSRAPEVGLSATTTGRPVEDESTGSPRLAADGRTEDGGLPAAIEEGLQGCWPPPSPSRQQAREWRSALRVVRPECALPVLRRSMLWYPLSSEMAIESVSDLMIAHVNAGHWGAVESVARLCPELGLDFLVSGNGIR